TRYAFGPVWNMIPSITAPSRPLRDPVVTSTTIEEPTHASPIACRMSPGRERDQNHQHVISIRQIMASLFGLAPRVTLDTARNPRLRFPCHQLMSADGMAAYSETMNVMKTIEMSRRERTNDTKKMRNTSRVT